jgi:hypothetical protein
MEYIAILVILLITSSVIFVPNQWDTPIKSKRKHTNTKYIIPAEFWVDYNDMLQAVNDMTQGNARVVFQKLNQLNEKYHRLFMNVTYDEKMTQLIEKYNAKINYFHNQKTK